MSDAVKCPVCGGCGKVYIPQKINTTSSSEQTQTCHGCKGAGWVTIN